MTLEDALSELFDKGRKYGFRPDMPLGMEEFFVNFLKKYQASASDIDFNDWLDAKLPEAFPSLCERPRWLQDPEWPLHNGEPMLFVGQLDRKMESSIVSFFIFKSRYSGVTKVITQTFGVI